MGLAERIEAATPPDRDRYLDALRVLALVLVVVGHWLVRTVTAGPESEVVTGYLLEIEPHWYWATLLWQVMPVFFFVGGAVNAASWRRARAGGESPEHWLRRRARGLMSPMLPLLAVLLAAVAALHATGRGDLMVFDFGVAIIPAWFLAAYLAVGALTPLTLALHERGHALRLIAAATALAVTLDMARFLVGGPVIGTQPLIAVPNFLLVWLVVHQLGYLLADGHLPATRGGRLGLALAGAAALAAMIGSGLYPLSMLPIEGTRLPNNGSPPSAALIALALVQIGLALLARRRVTRWLHRPALWAPVAVIGQRMITVFLWHQPVLVAVAALVYPAGWMPLTGTVGALWWAWRPVWLLYCLIVLVPVVALVSLVKPPDPSALPLRLPGGYLAAAFGVALFGAGVAGLIATRMWQPEMPLGLPLAPLVAVLAGLALLGVLARRNGEDSSRR
jgi:fucose 4-O-acetylase-like acetyltransferase